MQPNTPILEGINLSRIFASGNESLRILGGLNLTVNASEFVAITGKSGSGKSTLLHLLGGLDRPDEGDVKFRGASLYMMNEIELARFRSQHIGFVFQFHHLLGDFSALENIAMPSIIAGKPQWDFARELLDRIGLSARANHIPTQLSGGEQQRVAIARAMVNRPDVLLMDEPTGNLDAENSHRIFDMLRELCQSYGATAIVVTHSLELAARCDRQITISAV
ncbi:ABC transporter ATP-binding protein [Chrysiogenes arsenatis]|uniref:ABC transporter ATP-binding protein n=1 Tax=Chrysiogenes arsenatis TaxID=309797 RepID=UPI000407112D|nr:ABC transporter ATP-binding protein [Chrysiogenes arsenatis]